MPKKPNTFLQLGVKSVTTLNQAWAFASSFTGIQRYEPLELCRSVNSKSPITLPPQTERTDPLYQAPANQFEVGVSSQSRLKMDGMVYCYKVPRSPLQSAGGFDILLKKYNATRDVVWAIRAGGMNDDVPAAVTDDLVGNIFHCAHMYGAVTIGSRLLTGGKETETLVRYTGSQTSNRVRKLVVMKHDTGGKFLWATEIGACMKSSCWLDTISNDEMGYTYVSGRFYGTMSGIFSFPLPEVLPDL